VGLENMSLASRAFARIFASLFLAVSTPFGVATAGMIDFESLPGGMPADGAPVGTQYFGTAGMRFGVDLDGDGHADAQPTFEHAGIDDGWAFVNDFDHKDDEALPAYAAQLGTWMLRSGISHAGQSLLITYGGGVHDAAGEIWDIDGNPEQGTEQWRIDALGVDGAVLATMLSPLGTTIDTDSLNAKPWSFDIDRATDDVFGLRITFVGTKTVGLGAAFDHFYCTIPEPGTLALVGLGVALLARRRS
jgi:PEP-CTERM motif-containing protein